MIGKNNLVNLLGEVNYILLPCLSLGFPGGSTVKNLHVNARNVGLTHGLGRSPGGGSGNPLHYCLENLMDIGAWWDTVHGVMKESDKT